MTDLMNEECRDLVMTEINWLKAIGFKCVRQSPLHFMCCKDNKVIQFEAEQVLLEGLDQNNVRVNLCEIGSEAFRNILATFLY